MEWMLIKLYDDVKKILDNVVDDVIGKVTVTTHLDIIKYCNEVLDEVEKAEYVIHGYWIADERYNGKMCSCCYAIGDGGNYCSHCGAKMDGGKNDT